MEQLFAKMEEYLKMDTEISYEEFTNYYENVMNMLKEKIDELGKEDYLKARFILTIIGINAEGRAQNKNAYTKKYKKIKEKVAFWADAVTFRLKQMGMTQAEIEQAYQETIEAI